MRTKSLQRDDEEPSGNPLHRLVSAAEKFHRLPLWLRLVFLPVLGAGLVLAQAPFHQLWVIFLCLPPLALYLDEFSKSGSKKLYFATGFLFGLGYFVFGLHWIRLSFDYFPDIPSGGGWLAVIALGSALSCFYGLATYLAGRFWSPHPRRILLLVALLGLLDCARALFPLGGLPINLLGYALASNLELMQGLSITGSFGYSFLLLAIGLSPACLFSATNNWEKWWIPLKSLCFLLFLFGFGVWRLGGDRPAPLPDFTLHLIQPNISQSQKMDPDSIINNLLSFKSLSEAALENSKFPTGKRILLYPETAIHLPLDRYHNVILEYLPIGLGYSALITGTFRETPNTEPLASYFNSLYAVNLEETTSTRVQLLYDKVRLAPFGEYTPLAELIAATGLVPAEALRGLSAGTHIAPVKIEGLPPFLPLICFDVLFPDFVRRAAGEADWLFVATNDGWFQGSFGPYQHFHQTQARAVELGLPLVRSAPSGISAIIDPLGQIIGEIDLESQGFLEGQLPARLPTTFYRDWGEWPTLFIMLILFVYGLSGRFGWFWAYKKSIS